MKTLTLFDQNLGLTPFEKFQTFDFFNFYCLQKVLFFFLEYRETIFLAYFVLN